MQWCIPNTACCRCSVFHAVYSVFLPIYLHFLFLQQKKARVNVCGFLWELFIQFSEPLPEVDSIGMGNTKEGLVLLLPAGSTSAFDSKNGTKHCSSIFPQNNAVCETTLRERFWGLIRAEICKLWFSHVLTPENAENMRVLCGCSLRLPSPMAPGPSGLGVLGVAALFSEISYVLLTSWRSP